MELKIIEDKPEIKTVAIITPTIGNDTLRECRQSVKNQTFKNIKHYVVVDGNEHAFKVLDLLENAISDNSCLLHHLPENVGKGWYGHRTYAAFSFLFNADAVCFLDEDNWLEPDHVENLVKAVNENNADWGFSYRKIYDKDGNFICLDNCESLGIHPVYNNDSVFHIDTSSYLVRQEVATRVAGAWYGQWGADRQYFGVLAQHFPNVAPSLKHSLCYRLDGNPNSVTAEFFEKGNEAMHKRYGDKLPWITPAPTQN